LRFFLQSQKIEGNRANQRTLTNKLNMEVEVRRNVSAMEDNEGEGELKK